MSLSDKFDASNIDDQPSNSLSTLNWDKVDDEQKVAYATRLSSL